MVAIRKPALAPHLLTRYLPGEGLFLVSEHGSDVLLGETFAVLLPLLSGTLTVDEILDRVASNCGEAEVLYALELLNSHGCLVDGLQGSGSQEGFWSARRARACSRKVTLINRSSQGIEELTMLLQAQGVKLDPADGLRVVLVDDYLDPGLRENNLEGLATQAPWMLLKPTGNILWFGPVFVPGRTGCWECMADRLQLNRRVLRFLERRLTTTLTLPPVSAPVTRALAASIAVNQIIQWLCADTSALEGRLCTFDTISHAFDTHVLTRRPQCAVCGTPAVHTNPLSLNEAPQELASRDGGFRTRTATEVFASLKQHISPILGVVPHLHPLNTGDDGIHVYVCGQNLGATGGTLNILANTIRNLSSGKGLTDIQAKTSALCESIERYATVFQGHEPHILASAEELAEKAIPPNACMLFSETQYAEREMRNVGADGFTRIPKPLHPKDLLLWSPVWSLPDHQQKYCPTAYLYFHSDALKDPVGAHSCMPDSNGVATGSTYSEAILQGLLELIERDAVALWWYPRTAVPRVNLESFDSEFLSHCSNYHKRIGRELWALDVTSDLGIPSFVGISRKVSGEQQILMGFGAHLDAKIALQRAVAETNQLLTGVEAHLRAKEAYSCATTRWLRSATVEREIYLRGREDCLVSAAKYKCAPLTVKEALQKCLDAIHRAGLKVYTLDLTRPDIDLKVVRVLCPGIRHFWARLAPGRLYEVPFLQGLIADRQREQDLNPIAMFL